MGHAGQLRRHPHRLPSARRAPRLDRRHRGVRADRHLSLRLRGISGVVVARPRGGTARRRQRALGDPRRARLVAAGRSVGRRRRHRSHDTPRAVRRRRRARAAVRQHAGVGRPRARAGGRRPVVDRRVPVRRLARSHRRPCRPLRPAHRSRSARDRGHDPLAGPRSRDWRASSVAATTRSATRAAPTTRTPRSHAEYVAPKWRDSHPTRRPRTRSRSPTTCTGARSRGPAGQRTAAAGAQERS